MALLLNLFRARFERPDAILAYLSVPKASKPKDIFAKLWEPSSATRIVHHDRERQIVFLRGVAPSGVQAGNALFEWSAFPPLGKAVLEQSLADALGSRFTIIAEEIDDRPWGFMAFRKVSGITVKHFDIEEGISFRAIELPGLGEFAIAVEWKSRVRFVSTLAEPEMLQIAEGSSVMLMAGQDDVSISRFEGKYIGRVQNAVEDTASVTCRDGVERTIPSKYLQLESGPRNFAKFDRRFPRLAPPGGLMSAMLRADKSLDGNMRNRRVFRDRLDAIVAALAPNQEASLQVPVCCGGNSAIAISLTPIELKLSEAISPLTYQRFEQPGFVYRNGGTTLTGKKIDGLIKHGPFRPPTVTKPVFGFIFPEQHREDARKLFVALRDGIGLFRGFANWFRIPFTADQVVHISGFNISDSTTNEEASELYRRALEQWLDGQSNVPELFFVIHDRTEAYEEATPYHVCKSRLLDAGIMTQNVTADLLRNRNQFEWSAANIALASFTKLGGTPWTLQPTSKRSSLIVGIGRAEQNDPTSRTRRRFQAFATCVSSKGIFGFSSISASVETEEELPSQLAAAAVAALTQAEESEVEFDSLVVHLTGNLKIEDRKAIEKAVEAYTPTRAPIVCVLGISDRADIFAVSDENEYGMPARGTCVCLSKDHFLLFTEGMEDMRSAARRTPCAVQVRLRHIPDGVDPFSLIAQVYDLSQVNFRAFNGASKPVSILYSELIARLLRHENVIQALEKHPDLRTRMWFL